jgi:hypothetical protein
MLWSRPVRAQRPIVPDVKRTFDAASRSAASDREIQSVGGFDIGQSVSFGAVSPPDPAEAPDSAPDPALEPPEPLESDSFRAGLLGRPEERSLRAQPVPLKWTASGPMALRMCAPHLGQAGPSPWTECMTSISWPQDVQM